MRDIDNRQDTLDSRDVIARRDELTEERVALVEEVDVQKELAEGRTENNGPAADNSELQAAEEALAEWDADNAEELAALEAFIAEGSDEWRHGVTLVRESYFEDYAQELAEELDLIPRDARWPATCIDWEQAARELQYDYTGADWAGVTYYYQG